MSFFLESELVRHLRKLVLLISLIYLELVSALLITTSMVLSFCYFSTSTTCPVLSDCSSFSFNVLRVTLRVVRVILALSISSSTRFMFILKSSSLFDPISSCFSSRSMITCWSFRIPGLVVALPYFFADSLFISACYLVYMDVKSVLLFLSALLADWKSLFNLSMNSSQDFISSMFEF